MHRAMCATLLLALACSPAPPVPLPPNAIAFGVFGDGPYARSEIGRFRRLLEDVDRANVQWLLHVGDILGVPCSDALLAQRHATLNAMRVPVIYTPGDNEWADCYRRDGGRFNPLERLRHIRQTFFAQPRQSLGRQPMRLESQSDSAGWSEFVENTRWRRGRFLFITVHMVGSANAGVPYQGDTAAQGAEVARRTEAALHWIAEAIAIAHKDSLHGVVVAMHADPGFAQPNGSWPAYARFVATLAAHASAFPGQILLIHGDHHEFRVDRPLTRATDRNALSNFTRLETFGSPDIGWVRVVIDTVAGRVLSYEPRKMRRRLMW